MVYADMNVQIQNSIDFSYQFLFLYFGILFFINFLSFYALIIPSIVKEYQTFKLVLTQVPVKSFVFEPAQYARLQMIINQQWIQ